eukprot:m.27256 g.27256  ORF g.27256 m.27256 type:complete len:81 (-) comp10206_c0_seq1:2195-2437(-)
MQGYRQVVRLVALRRASGAAKSQSAQATSTKLNTNNPDAKGYYGRSVDYTSVHTAQLDTYYDLMVEMAKKRLPQPKPKRA